MGYMYRRQHLLYGTGDAEDPGYGPSGMPYGSRRGNCSTDVDFAPFLGEFQPQLIELLAPLLGVELPYVFLLENGHDFTS